MSSIDGSGTHAGIEGHVSRRGQEGYEEARQSATWHAGTPNRFPTVIVQAKNENDVVAAVRLARDEGLKMAVRSGGHSWAGSHLRDGILLLDVSQLHDVSVDAAQMTATAQPGIKGSELGEILRKQGLYFPVGHCTDVCIGGYLLQGGFAWRGREFGPACMSVVGIDVVTADGTLTYADETQNADLFWAARGSGPGFFGVVTRFHVKLYPLAPITLSSFYVYPPQAWEEYYRWQHSIQGNLPPEVEIWVLMFRDESVSTAGPLISVSATAFADTTQQARDFLAIYETCPIRDRALVADLNVPMTTGELTSIATEHMPSGKRWMADNMWTHATFDDLLPGLREIQSSFPPAPSHMVWFPWRLAPERPSMAYSVEDEYYIALYPAWDDSADDEKYRSWVTERMRAMEHLATGVQLADENLVNRPRRFVTDENLRRLDQIRGIHDPAGLFVPWLGRPQLA